MVEWYSMEYIRWRQLRELGVGGLLKLTERGEVIITVDGSSTFRLTQIGTQSEAASNPVGTQGNVIPGGLKMHEEVDIHGNIVMARGRPRQNGTQGG